MNDSEARRPTFDVALQHPDGDVELVLSGELDIAGAPILRAALDPVVRDGQRDVRLNLSGLKFLDAAGLGAMASVAGQLARLGGRLTLTAPRGIPLRALSITGMLDRLTADYETPAAGSREIATPQTGSQT